MAMLDGHLTRLGYRSRATQQCPQRAPSLSFKWTSDSCGIIAETVAKGYQLSHSSELMMIVRGAIANHTHHEAETQLASLRPPPCRPFLDTPYAQQLAEKHPRLYTHPIILTLRQKPVSVHVGFKEGIPALVGHL